MSPHLSHSQALTVRKQHHIRQKWQPLSPHRKPSWVPVCRLARAGDPSLTVLPIGKSFEYKIEHDLSVVKNLHAYLCSFGRIGLRFVLRFKRKKVKVLRDFQAVRKLAGHLYLPNLTCICICSNRQVVDTQIQANKAKKTDIGKQGLSGIKNAVVKNNLMGISNVMEKKGWVDSQGNKGKVLFWPCLAKMNFQHQVSMLILYVVCHVPGLTCRHYRGLYA